MRSVVGLTVFFSIIVDIVYSQPDNQEDFPAFNPSVSSIMLNPGQWEFNVFSSYLFHQDTFKYHQAFKRDKENFVLYDVATNYSYWANTIQLSAGILPKLTIGLDLNYTLENIAYQIDTTIKPTTKQHAFRLVPRIRWLAYRTSKSNLVFQHFVQIPTTKQDSVQKFFSDYTFVNQAIWTIRLQDFILMSQLDLIIYSKSSTDNKRPFLIPFTFYTSYLINTETMIFGLAQYTSDFGNYAYAEDPSKYYHRASSVHLGFGIQRRIARNLNINVFYNHAVSREKYLGYHSINLGIRYATN